VSQEVMTTMIDWDEGMQDRAKQKPNNFLFHIKGASYNHKPRTSLMQ
jgi:hypothetical protein